MVQTMRRECVVRVLEELMIMAVYLNDMMVIGVVVSGNRTSKTVEISKMKDQRNDIPLQIFSMVIQIHLFVLHV